jgi:predicted membrane protein
MNNLLKLSDIYDQIEDSEYRYSRRIHHFKKIKKMFFKKRERQHYMTFFSFAGSFTFISFNISFLGGNVFLLIGWISFVIYCICNSIYIEYKEPMSKKASKIKAKTDKIRLSIDKLYEESFIRNEDIESLFEELNQYQKLEYDLDDLNPDLVDYIIKQKEELDLHKFSAKDKIKIYNNMRELTKEGIYDIENA